MLYQSNQQTIETFGTTEETTMKIAATGKAFHTLISGLYSSKIDSIVRESCANAFDAHIAAGKKDTPFEVHAPTRWEPWYSVRDYGVSMSHHMVMELYSTLFWSSKDASNEQVGCFGLGSKAPFSYTNEFSVVCWLDGVRRSYTAVIAEGGHPKIILMDESPSDDEQGVLVSFPVKEMDISAFHRAVMNVAKPYDPSFKSNLNGAVSAHVELESEHYKLVPTNGQPTIQVGPVWYPLDFSQEEWTRRIPTEFLPILRSAKDLVLKAPIGSVEVTPSRESISYTKTTCEAIGELATKALKDIQNRVKDRVGVLANIWDAAVISGEYSHATPNLLNSLALAYKTKWGKLGDLTTYAVRSVDESVVSSVQVLGRSAKISKRKTARMLRSQGCFLIIQDDAHQRVPGLMGLISGLVNNKKGMSHDGYLVRIPDPNVVRAKSARLRKLAPDFEKATVEELLHARKMRKRALDGLWETACVLRDAAKKIIAEFACPNQYDQKDIPVYANPARAGELPLEPALTKQVAVYQHTKTYRGVSWSSENVNPAKLEKKHIVMPMTNRKPLINFVDEDNFLAGVNSVSKEKFTGIFAVAESNMKSYLAQHPKAVDLRDVVAGLGQKKLYRAYKAVALTRLSVHVEGQRTNLISAVTERLGDKSPYVLTQFNNNYKSVVNAKKQAINKLSNSPLRSVDERVLAQLHNLACGTYPQVTAPEVTGILENITEQFPMFFEISSWNPDKRIQAVTAYVLGVKTLNQMNAISLHDGQEY